jgi:hypothetical protein
VFEFSFVTVDSKDIFDAFMVLTGLHCRLLKCLACFDAIVLFYFHLL